MLSEEELYEIEELSRDEVLCSAKYCPFIERAMASEKGDSDGNCGGVFCEEAYMNYKQNNILDFEDF